MFSLEVTNFPSVMSAGVPTDDKNWPPFFPIIHHDIANEIPAHAQRLQYLAFASWLGTVCLIVLLVRRFLPSFFFFLTSCCFRVDSCHLLSENVTWIHIVTTNLNNLSLVDLIYLSLLYFVKLGHQSYIFILFKFKKYFSIF